jgi:hypothetical protein
LIQKGFFIAHGTARETAAPHLGLPWLPLSLDRKSLRRIGRDVSQPVVRQVMMAARNRNSS